MAQEHRSAGDRPVVTAQMIKAGLQSLKKWHELPPGELLAVVYRAMATLAPTDGDEPAKQRSATAREILKRLANDG